MSAYFGATLPITATATVLTCGATLAANLLMLDRTESYVRERQRFFLSEACEPALSTLRTRDPSARLNIMRLRGLPTRRRFEFVYQSGFGAHDRDLRLSLRADQGVAGLAARHRAPAVADFHAPGNKVRVDGNELKDPWANMSAEQIDACGGLTVAISYPIFQLGRASEVSDVLPVGDLIGVANIDSRDKRASDIYEELLPQLVAPTTGMLSRIARVAAFILS